MPRSPDDWRLGAAIAALIGLIGIAAANRHIAGIYHDDGIYLASARSIAENGSYRLIDVPGAPLATNIRRSTPCCWPPSGGSRPTSLAISRF